MRSLLIRSTKFACFAIACACSALPEGGEQLATTDHYVTLKSSAPGMAGADTRIYVREISPHGPSTVPSADRVVLFVHGGAMPGSTVFDLPHADHSWMRYFAAAGYDTFAMDFTGYGRSTRPPPMNDPCNLPQAAQAQLVPAVIPAPCKPSHPGLITTMESEREEIDAVVEHLRKMRGVEKVAIVAWSRGGTRTAFYLLQHPQHVSRVFALGPGYGRDWPLEGGSKSFPNGSMLAGSRKGLDALWERQHGCDRQFDEATADAVWKDSSATDPLAAGWGAGMRRSLPAPDYGINAKVLPAIRVPFAVATGAYDKAVLPATARAFYEDLGSGDKVLIDLACSSHYAMWEMNHALLFKASLEWIRDGKVNGVGRGEVRLGY